MGCQWLVPGEPLARYVDRIFTLIPAPGGRRVIGLPQGNADIVFRAFRDGRSGVARGDIHAVGAQPQAFKIPDPELLVTLVVRFRPGGACPFFGVPMGELTDSAVPLQEIWGAAADEMLDQMLEAPSTSAWVRLMKDTLHARLERSDSGETSAVTIASLVTDAVARSEVLPSVRSMAEALGISERHLHRQFHDATGLRPKLYARIARFKRAVAMACRPQAPSWAELSLEAGYCDQAHLIRDCQKLTLMSPSQFISTWKRGRMQRQEACLAGVRTAG